MPSLITSSSPLSRAHFWADEELGRPSKVVDVFLTDVVDFTCFIFQVQGDGAYPLGINDPPDSVDVCITHLF